MGTADVWLVMQGDAGKLPLAEDSVDAVVTDPPYGISFMGKNWDHGVPGVPFWQELRRVMKPGAFAFVFSSTRTFHRLGVALEDAGLDMHPFVAWLFGSGFPKATRIDTQIDAEAGAKRERVGRKDELGIINSEGQQRRHDGWDRPWRHDPDADGHYVTLPATEEARRWEGHRYGKQALKPAIEPILCVQKPYDGKPVDSIRRHGVGAFHIEACRVGTGDGHGGGSKSSASMFTGGGYAPGDGFSTSPNGRWPPNVLLTHSEGCRRVGSRRVRSDGHYPAARGRGNLVEGHAGQSDLQESFTAGEAVDDWRCVPGCPVAALDAQSGNASSTRAGGNPNEPRRSAGWTGNGIGHDYRDSGGASRFFPQFQPDPPFMYCAKASRSEREAGLCRFDQVERRAYDGQFREKMSDPRMDRPQKRHPIRNAHPTVKPVDLCAWLIRLICPPNGVVLDPFCGSGSVGCAAMQEGRHFVGLDLEREYVEIARARIAHYEGLQNRPEPRRETYTSEDPAQKELFR